jgi:hypothetical protein
MRRPLGRSRREQIARIGRAGAAVGQGVERGVDPASEHGGPRVEMGPDIFVPCLFRRFQA